MRHRVWLIALLNLNCGAGLPSPPRTAHPVSAFVSVPYPPPAALAETVPPRPDRQGVVWLDGEWIFRADSYVWRRGGWVVAPPEGRFAAWQTRYRKDGRLELASSSWYDANARPLPFIEPIAPAVTPPNELTSEVQTGR
ncbi:MAG TPA: hypothetical protein VHM70_29430 [Polyangiaceae bacterium]|jgi:hypothetical protein|nr:hypothetical protein [Polyangiaceae bacterium]